jgi:hypothetical protein
MSNNRKIPFRLNWLALTLLLTAAGWSVRASDATAFDLIKEGNRYVGEEVKDQIVQIRSEKSIANLTPTVWYVVYYDPDAALKATEVKFVGGKKVDVKRPMRLLEPVTGADKKLDRKRMKVDSDKALATATKDSTLTDLKLTASQMWLQHGDDAPEWKIRLWAAKVHDPSRDVDIGDIYLSADDGKVTRRDLHIERVN